MLLSSTNPHRWGLGKQPQGRVRVNWDHPLSRGLKFAYLPTMGYMDLTTGLAMNRVGSTYVEATSNGVADSQVNTSDNGAYILTQTVSSPWSVRCDLAALTAFTLVKNKATAGNNAAGCFRRGGPSGNAHWCVGLSKGSSLNGLVAVLGSFVDTPNSSTFDGSKKFYACAVTGDGATANSYIDGVLSKTGAYTPPSYAYDGSIYRSFQFGSLGFGYANNDYMALALFWDHALSADEIRQLSADPYCFFEVVPSQMIGVTVLGGTAYSASLALGLQMATVDNAGLAATGAVSLGMAAGVSEAGNMSAVSALTLGLQAGLSDNAANALAGAVSLGAQMGLGDAASLGAQAAFSLGAILGVVPGAEGPANYVAALSLGVIASTGATSGLQAVSSLALGLGLTIVSASIDQISGSLNLAVIAGAGINAGQDFTVNIPLGLLAGLQTGGGKGYGASLALGLVVGQAIAAASGLQVTPEKRVLRVQAENRTLTIQVENRNLVIVVENRTINVKLE